MTREVLFDSVAPSSNPRTCSVQAPMAGNLFDPNYPGAPFFDIYNDPSAVIPRSSLPSLPDGACNYVDLTPGANGTKCGCRRFWIRSAVGSPTGDGAGWCMCNHHACFHDHGSGHDAPAPVMETGGHGQENERPRSGREPLSPVVDSSIKMPPPPTTAGTDLPIYPIDDPLSFIYNNPEEFAPDTRMPAVTTQPLPGSLPDTLAWSEPVQSPAQPNKLAQDTSQGPIPSQATSTTSSVRAKYFRPFSGKGLDTLAGRNGAIRTSSPFHPQPSNGEPGAGQRDSLTADGSFVLVAQEPASSQTVQTSGDTQPEPRTEGAEPVSRTAFKNLSDAVSGHEQRLDRLETVSFTAGGHDECHDKHDHMDLRVTDLESRMEDVEKFTNENAAAVGRLSDKNDDGTTQSVASFSTAGTSRPTHSQEIYSQIQSLQAQVDLLQSAVPTTSHPWELDIVFLPFPLKKVWQEIHQFKSESGLGLDDWTQMSMTCSTRTLRSQSPLYGDWASADHDAEWLLPRGCNDKSVVDRRLRSRGLIKKISVTAPDARSVHRAVHMAFDEVWHEMQMPPSTMSSDPRVVKYVGLQSPWVPLRKIHKDSRLRFLSPSEMISPAFWDVQFLASVMMRSAEPRLFITHPDAYLQNLRAYETGWTWQKVRELTRVYPGVSESQEVPEADACEEYWQWNELYDESPSSNTSMSLRNERKRMTASPSQQGMPGQSWRSSSPLVAVPGQPSAMGSRRGPRPPHIRTVSVPLNVSTHPSPAMSRRRVVSNGQSRRSSPSIRGTSQFAAIMKRRQTRSPSYPRQTPRWTASPSPMPPGMADRQYVRGMTPFAYATPHSNAPLQEMRPVRAGSAVPVPAEYMDDMTHDMDELYEIEIYESESDGSYVDDGIEDDGDGDSAEMVTHPRMDTGDDSRQRWRLPEDEPWPGIEDQEHLSDGENVDPNHAERHSEASSQPSEYPSTQRAWPDDTTGAEFHIHEDGNDMDKP